MARSASGTARSARACGRRSRRRSPSGASPSRTCASPSRACSAAIWCPRSPPRKDDEGDALEMLALHPRRRREQPALSRAGDREARRDQWRAPGIRARRSMPTRFGIYGTPAAGVSLEKLESRDRCRDRGVPRQGTDDGRARASQEPHDRRHIYAQDNQSTLARMYGAALTTGSTVEAVQDAARPAARRHRRAGARCGAALSRQAPVGHRLSGQGRRGARGEEVVSRLFAIALASGRRLSASHGCRRRQQDRADPRPGGIKAWLVREPSVPMVALDYAFKGGAQRRSGRQAGRRHHARRLARRGRRRARCARVPGADGGEGDPARLHGQP